MTGLVYAFVLAGLVGVPCVCLIIAVWRALR